jgi:hypothetical protein
VGSRFNASSIYADYQPGAREAEMVDAAFEPRESMDQFMDQSEHNWDQLSDSKTQ